MSAKIIDGRKIAKKIRKQISEEIVELRSKYNTIPNIKTIKIGKDPSSELYLRLRDNACKEVGINSEHIDFRENASEDEILNVIYDLNNDIDVHGVLVQFPIPNQISSDKLVNAINPKKDVEGFNPFNMGKIYIGNEQIVPCTPLAVLTILEHENIVLKGMDVTIVNHSNVVGKPLAMMLLNRNASVSVCHIFTKDLKQYTCKADILVTATGVPKLITKDHVKKDAFVIDVGIVKTEDGICGDVDFFDVKDKAGMITPVPGGVGPVTIACSLKNMIKTFKNCMDYE